MMRQATLGLWLTDSKDRSCAGIRVALSRVSSAFTKPLGLLAIAMFWIASSPAAAQDLTGTVTTDPQAGTVTYTIDLDGPPSGPGVKKFALPLLDPNWLLPGSIIAPPNWNGAIVPSLGSLWNYDSLFDPKAQGGLYGPNPEIFENPGFIILFDTDIAPVLPGQNLGGFSFISPQLPINAPAQFLLTDDQLVTIDPPVPGPVPIPEPSAMTLAGLGLIGLLAYGWQRRRRA